MPQQLWLLRHGEAVPHGAAPDPERELTPVGERQAQAAGIALARLGIELAACYASPKVRARATATLACEALGLRVEDDERVASGPDVDDARELLLAHEDTDRILVVGHEPYLGQLVHDLTGARVDFKKGGIAAVKLTPAPELLALLRPRELATIAGLQTSV